MIEEFVAGYVKRLKANYERHRVPVSMSFTLPPSVLGVIGATFEQIVDEAEKAGMSPSVSIDPMANGGFGATVLTLHYSGEGEA